MSKWRGGVIRSTQITPGGNGETDAASGVWRASDAAYWVRQQQWPGSAPRDPYFAYNSIMLTGNGINRAQNNLFVDSSSSYFPVTRFGNTTQGSSSPYGNNWSAYFDGSGDYLQTPASSATTLVGTMNSSTNLTIECWINPTAYNNNSNNFPGLIGDMNPTAQVDYWSWGLTSTGTLMLYWYISGSQYRAYTTGTVSLNTWSHIALNISAGAITMYINGVSQAISGTSTLGAVSGSVGYLAIGQWNNGGSTGDAGNYTGYISNLRIVKASTYTTNFTPSTTPLAAITSTSLLTCAYNNFRDGSTNNFTITRGGDVRVRNGPFAVEPGYLVSNSYNQNDVPNWSNYFDGNGDYLSWSGYTAMAFGSAAFTVEAWVYLNAMPTADSWPTSWSSHMVIVTVGTASTGDGTGFLIGSNRLAMQVNDTSYWSTSHGMTAGQWYHVAVSRSSNTLYFFVNGVAKGTASLSGNVGTGGSTFVGCETGEGAYLNGYISNLRCIAGTALYTSAFTPPSSALTAVSGTSLLTCQNPAFVDNSTNAFAIGVSGDTKINGFSPFGGTSYSAQFDGSSDWIATPSDAAFGFGTGDFTIECWTYPTDTKANMRLWQFGGDSDNADISVTSTGSINYYNGSTSTTSSGGLIKFFAWNHVAFVRSSGTMRVYVNGSLAVTQATTPNTTSRILYIGGQANSHYKGFIYDFRVVKGTAVYTSTFTPPTDKLTAISGTVLLTCRSSTLIDESTNNFTLTRNGDTKISSFYPFNVSSSSTNTGSMFFDGSGDYLTLPTEAGQIGTSDFTLECWYRSNTATASTHCPIIANYEANSNGSWALKASSSNDQCVQFAYYNNGWNDLTTTKNITADMAWHHVAVTRAGTTLRLYVDGVLINSWTVSASLGGNGYTVQLGRIANDNAVMNGFMTDARLITGTALYTGSTYTVPTAPLTAVAGTRFLVDGMNANVVDSTRINNLETTGDTKISTSIKKYGSGSILMDGSGDWLYTPGSDAHHFASGNFTMEGWFYFTNANANALQTIYSNYTTWGAAHGTIYWGKHSSTSGYMSAWFSNYSTSTPLLAETSMPPSNTWTHYAIVRNGNTFTMYRNGTATASATYTGAATNGACPVFIGTNGDGTQYPFPGYIDDFRITRGVARYTANFTPPTAALPTR